MFLISLVLILSTSVKLSTVLAITVPFIVIGVIVIAKISEPLSETQQKRLDKLNRISRENLTGIRVIRAFGNDNHEKERFEETNEAYASVSKKLFKLMAVSQPSFFLLLNVAILAIFWVSSNMIDAGTLQIGELVAFIEYLFHAMFSLMLFSNVFVMYPKAQVSAERIQEILDAEPMIKNPEQGITETNNEGTLEFENVTFVYPDGEEPVIKNDSFSAKKGETIAFIGSTGSGKSTILDAITIALYGDIARDATDYINTSCDKAMVKFEFEIGSKNNRNRYFVERTIKNTPTGGTKTTRVLLGEIKPDGDINVLADKVGEVKNKIQEIIGLTSDDFTRSVVLPQGKFSEFLKLQDRDRRKMLERIFNLEKYGQRLSTKVKIRRNTAKEHITSLNGKLRQHEGMTEDLFEEKK